MDFTTGQYTQLIVALAMGVMLFAAAYVAPPRWSINILILMIPFQIIGSRFGTMNMVLIYLVGAAFLVRGMVRHLPMIGFFIAILFAYLLSFSQAFRATYPDHVFYMIGLGANLVLFYLVYNHFRDSEDLRGAFNVLVWMNLLVIGYCLLQLATGVERFSFMGVQELSLADKDIAKQRLVGPFGAAGTNGEFFALQIFVLAYLVLHAGDRTTRWFLAAILLLDLGFLIMTGSRGSFLAFAGGALLFLWMFRKSLGFRRVMRISVIGATGLAVVIAVVINFSQFNVLFDRLAETEFEGALPDTRAKAFTMAWEKIPNKMILGHGPRLRLMNEESRRIRNYYTIPYPHNLYLYLLYTVGVVGLIAYLALFLGLFLRWRRASRYRGDDPFRDGLATLGMLLMIVFLVDQLKIEFLRVRLSDHQQYMFALWAMLMAAADLRIRPQSEPLSRMAAAEREYCVSAADGGATQPRLPGICFVGQDNYPVLNPAFGSEYFGGESVQQTLLARAFAARGHSVSMVVKDHGQPQGETRGDIRVWKTHTDDAGLPVLRFLHPRMTSILRALAAADADVYYQSCAGMMTGLVAWFCQRHRRRFVFRLAHDSDCVPGEQIIRLWRDRKIYEYGLRHADFIAAQGTHQVALLKKHYGLRSTPVNMAVELPQEEPAERDIDVLWVNNLREFKRPELALDLAERMPELRIVMIGGPVPGRESLFNQIQQRAADIPNLEFLGAVPYHEVNGWFQRSRVFCNTSDQEGFPNSFLQAWIRGVPVISFFDPDGLIAGQRLGAAPASLDDMARTIGRLCGTPQELEALSARCRQYALAHYAPDAVARSYIELDAIGG